MSEKRKEAICHSLDMLKKQKYQPKLTQKDKDDVETLFSKQFKYKSVSVLAVSGDSIHGNCHSASAVEDWIGENPTLARQVFPDPELMVIKQKLNATKDQLSSKDIETWHAHTTNCNIATRVIPYVKRLNVELCTQAWVKFYEILSTFNIVPNQDFLSVHLCEAPGAFVTSLNHYLQQQAINYLWDWRATTLNPYYEANTSGEMIADDRLIRHTYPQWFFGKDGSGDITAENHVRDLCVMLQQVIKGEEFCPLLVTADGSRDCQTNPAEQESLVSRLQYCEMISAGLILDKGGNFVLKVFTMLEPPTVTLLFLLNVMFAEVHATKPATSKSGNSEIYLVCLGYQKNVSEETLWKLLDLSVYNKADGTVNFIKDIPTDFIHEHRICCQLFADWQIQTIVHNIEMFEDRRPDVCHSLQEMQELALEKFVNLTGVSRVRPYRRIVESYHNSSTVNLKLISCPRPNQTRPDWRHKNLKGTFFLRQNFSNLSWEERVKLMEMRENPQPNMILQSSCGMKDKEVAECMEIEMGNDLSVIENSRLCDIDLMKDLTLLMRNSDLKKCRQPLCLDHATKLGKLLSGQVVESCSNHCGPASTSYSVNYWVGSIQDENSPLYQSFIANSKSIAHVKHVCTEEDFISMAASSEQQVHVFCNVTSFGDDDDCCSRDLNYDELTSRRKCIELVTKLLRHLPLHCHRLILLSSTFLSRLTAGILYILARSFNTTSMYGEANMWFHQIVVLEDYLGVSPALLDNLSEATKLMENQANEGQTVVMEVVKFFYLLNDRKFVQFVTAYNNFTVTGFINEMLQHYRGKNSVDSCAGVVPSS